MAIQNLSEVFSLGVSTDGRNHKSQNLFPVVIQYLHKVHGIKSELIQLNSTPNEKLEMIVDCVTQALKDHGLLTKCVVFSGDNTNTNFGGTHCYGSKDGFHALKH